MPYSSVNTSHFMTYVYSVSMSWCRVPLWALRPDFFLFGCGAFSRTRGGSVVYPLGVPLSLCSSRRGAVMRYEHDIQCLSVQAGAADSALTYSAVALTTAQSLEQSPA